MKPRNERLLQSHHEIERPHLSAVGVSGELETDPEGLGVQHRPRLVGQQDQLSAGVAIAEGAPERLLGREPTVMNGGAVVDPGQIESNGTVVNSHPLVAQHPNAESIELAQPGFRTRKIFMVAGHEKHAVRCPERGQRRDGGRELCDRPVNEIAGDRDEVGRERIGLPDDLLDEGSTDGGTDVEVGELDDSKSVLVGRQPVESNAHPAHLDRFTHRSKGGPRQSGGQGSGHARGQPGEQRPTPEIERSRRRDAPCDRRQQSQQVGRNEDREQQKHDPEPDVTSPNESSAHSPLSASENQREGNACREQ